MVKEKNKCDYHKRVVYREVMYLIYISVNFFGFLVVIRDRSKTK